MALVLLKATTLFVTPWGPVLRQPVLRIHLPSKVPSVGQAARTAQIGRFARDGLPLVDIEELQGALLDSAQSGKGPFRGPGLGERNFSHPIPQKDLPPSLFLEPQSDPRVSGHFASLSSGQLMAQVSGPYFPQGETPGPSRVELRSGAVPPVSTWSSGPPSSLLLNSGQMLGVHSTLLGQVQLLVISARYSQSLLT